MYNLWIWWVAMWIELYKFIKALQSNLSIIFLEMSWHSTNHHHIRVIRGSLNGSVDNMYTVAQQIWVSPDSQTFVSLTFVSRHLLLDLWFHVTPADSFGIQVSLFTRESSVWETDVWIQNDWETFVQKQSNFGTYSKETGIWIQKSGKQMFWNQVKLTLQLSIDKTFVVQ